MGIERMEAGRIVGMMIGRQALWRRRANSLRRDGSIANLFPLTGGEESLAFLTATTFCQRTFARRQGNHITS